MKLSIRWKLILSIGLPLALIYLSLLAIEFRLIKQAAYKQVEDYLQQLVSHHAESLNSEFSRVAQVAASTAGILSTPLSLTEDDLYRILEKNVEQDALVYGACLAFEPFAFDAKRKLVAPYVWRGADTNKPQNLQRMDIGKDAYDYLEWDWYRAPIEASRAVWTEPYFDAGAGGIIMTTYSAPFFREGRLWGISTVDVHLEKLQNWNSEKFNKDVEGFVILSREGRFLSHPNPEYIMTETLFSLAEKEGRPDLAEFAKRVLSGGSGMERVDQLPFAHKSFIVYAPIRSTGWVFAASLPESRVMALVWKQLFQFSAFMLLSLGVIIGILLVASIRITAPIRKLSLEFRRVASGNLELAPNGNYPRDEIGHLADTFHQMVVDLKTHVQALTVESSARQAVESEFTLARQIQTSLLPRVFPPFPEHKSFDLYALNVPAKLVAGDFFDFFFVSPNRLALVIGDVSGKGMSAALTMAITRTLVRTYGLSLKTPAEILSAVNNFIARDNEHGFFVTMILALYDTETGAFQYANAGHPVPYRIASGGRVSPFGEVTGTVVGVFPDVRFEAGEESLLPGESIVLFTDGVTEARSADGTFFGEARLEELFQAYGGGPVAGLCGAIHEKVALFQGQHFADDFTVMVLHKNT